ncbi:SusC/RagA family TonB-linked outer membrane protein [Rudanella paleaurantiibacter]|uniref:SusC/RagA family TonB-linked outer membrane protein n=2 Tax=Rudanella paleaurantiibacter TaxID=2614655 RepID=A0A7J5TS36_9BACT|nr:SusC/RagA family TonB-linked outer membrane protein [Rudanella paleaurantiibacter]
MKKSNPLLLRIMKFSMVQLLVSCLFVGLSWATDVSAQELLDRRLSIEVYNEKVKTVLTSIERSTRIKFSYSPQIIQANRKLTYQAQNATLGYILNNLLPPLQLTYTIIGNQIILKQLSTASPTSSVQVFPAEKLTSLQTADQLINGRVTSETGEGLPGVNVLLKGSTRGTSTDAEGRFRLNVPESGERILVFSMVGYTTQEIALGSRTTLELQLVPDDKLLSEVVVVGYGVQKRANLTGSVATIDQKFLANRPITNSSQALQGLSGVYVNMSRGRPGNDGATISIRGVGSFGTNTNPLVLVDGVEYSLRDINPADIESITVLKDAASAAIYGNRAANGVVLVKTRGGEKGRFKVDYNGYGGYQEATTFPDVVSNAVAYMEGKNRALANQGSPAEYPQALIDEYKTGTDPYIYPNSNWFDIMFRKAPQQEHNIRFSGGNERTSFALSMGYLNQQGVLIGSGAKRYSINTNLTSEINNRLRVGGNIIANFWDYRETAFTSDEGNGEGGLMGLIYRGLPMQVATLADGSYADQWVRVPGHNFYRNPYALALEGFRKNGSFSALFNLFAEVQLPANLKYKVTVAPNISFATQKFNNPSIDLKQPKTGAIAPMGNIPPRGVRQELNNALSLTNFHTLTWNKVMGRSAVDALAGFSLEMFSNSNFSAANQGYFANEISELNAGSANPVVQGTSSQSRLMSFFGRVNYAFNDRYLFEANFRYDGSSRFAADKRWGFFPSLSAGWRLSEEAFLKGVQALSNLKLRASWGQLGSQPQQLYGFVPTVTSGINYNFNNNVVTGGAITQIAEQNLTWETTTMTDIGLEFGFFNQRLTGEVDWFNKVTSGILRQVNIPQQVGNLTGPVRNVGEVQNKGIEVALAWRDKIGKVGYNVGGNLTQVANTVLNTNGQQIFNGNRVIFEGYPIDSYFGLRAMGYFQNADEITGAPRQNTVTLPGDIRYRDLNGDNKIDNQDREVIGNTFPKYTYSFTLGADYKGLDFSAFLQGVEGVTNYVNANLGFPYRNGAGVTQDWLTESWTPENPDAKYPRLTTANGYPQNFQVSDFWLRNASYLRLKNIQLGYTLPATLTKRLGVSRVRAFVNGQNILTFTDFSLGDPERNAANETIIAYPIPKTITGGLNLTF